MLKEIILSASFLVSGVGYSQNTSTNTITPNDSLLIELLSKDYPIQDTSIIGFPLQKQKSEAYKQLKQGYSHPERIDIIIKEISLTTSSTQNEINSLLEKVLADTSNDPVTNFLIGECYRLNKNLEKANEYYKKAIQQGLYFSFANLYIADFRFDDISNKITNINRALTAKNIEKKDIPSLKRIRKRFLKQSQKLIPQYQKVIEIDPTNKSAYYHLCEVYFLNNMYVESLETLNKAFEIPPTEVVDYIHRMIILEEMFKEDLSEDVQKAVKERFLRDVDIAFNNYPIMIYDAYLDMIHSDIFTEEEIEAFKEKYKEIFKSKFIQQELMRQDTLQK